jgi:Fe2+ transport system protein FeoA
MMMPFGLHYRHRRCNNRTPVPVVHHLGEGYEDQAYHIVANPDRQSREMGFFPGMEVRVLRNVEGEHGLVVAAGSARYVVARKAAAAIRVEPAHTPVVA